MACCSENHNICLQTTTIGWMKTLSGGHCCNVAGPDGHNGRCCSAEGDDYCPTFDEITGGTYASVRVVNENDPGDDVDGFVCLAHDADDYYDSQCCTLSDNAKFWCPPRNRVRFGYTSLDNYSLQLGDNGVGCDGSYTVVGKAEFFRGVRTCGANSQGNISETVVTVYKTVNDVSSGTLTKTTEFIPSSARDDGYDAILMTYSEDRVSDTYKFREGTHCEATASDTIDVSKGPFEFKFSGDTETEIPCSGGTFVLKFVEDDECATIDAFTITAKFKTESTPLTRITDGEIPHDELWFEVGENLNSDDKLVVTVGVDDIVAEVTYTLNRKACGYVSDYTNDGPCGTSFGFESWEGVDNVVWHPYDGI